MEYALYVSVKLIAYIGWCWFALQLWGKSSATVTRAAMFGILRLTIGIVFGAAIFLSGPVEPEHLAFKYVAIYAPVRILEWLILACIIGRESENRKPMNVILWCAGGVVVSFLADFASPEGIEGHFCVGRCLC